ncbi:hypothetical protein AVEN_125187-1 [Araneus ventricosus]|uniref:Uncharacterized protein n=1 Tax=Araneus ventricosus TaxID=182803 RepID=A0A4Y2NJL9_ARAVE|nr:hypothetical protein AVEN_125187-1 [Araneus ventricosus]
MKKCSFIPSSSYRQRKKKFVKLIFRSELLLQTTKVYMSKQARLHRIVDAGQRLLVPLHGGKDDYTLNGLRFQSFTKLFGKDNFNLDSLPPTLEAVFQHSLRTNQQI